MEPVSALVHRRTVSAPAFLAIVVACRFACAVAWPRTVPATRLAPLNHMLIQGFFFSQGFFSQKFVISVLPQLSGDSRRQVQGKLRSHDEQQRKNNVLERDSREKLDYFVERFG